MHICHLLDLLCRQKGWRGHVYIAPSAETAFQTGCGFNDRSHLRRSHMKHLTHSIQRSLWLEVQFLWQMMHAPSSTPSLSPWWHAHWGLDLLFEHSPPVLPCPATSSSKTCFLCASWPKKVEITGRMWWAKLRPKIHNNFLVGWTCPPKGHRDLTSVEHSNIQYNPHARCQSVISWHLWIVRAHASCNGNCLQTNTDRPSLYWK